MTEQQSNDLVAIKLDAERRREIDDIRKRMEEFLREQINVTNELKIVAKGQDSLKERFEMGVARTLSNLDKKFDTFMIEWGKKQVEDEARDIGIREAKEVAGKANDRSDLIFKGFTLTVMGGLTLTGIIWAVAKLLH